MKLRIKLAFLVEDKAFLLKSIFISLMGLVVCFIDKNNPWLHWSWILYFTFTIALLLIEYIDDKFKNQAPLLRVKRYLGDFEGWKESPGTESIEYYVPRPEFVIKPCDIENNPDFKQEWTRGEIGYLYSSGNAAYWNGIYFNDILLEKIHLVIFDGGKKSIVAPDYQAISGGRFYFYTEDSIRFIYQTFYAKKISNDFSKSLRKSGSVKTFDIPVFKNSIEFKKFIDYCDMKVDVSPLQQEEEQNTVFYQLLEKYQAFRKTLR